MAIKLSDLFGSMDEAFNNPKLEEMFNKTKDVAENMSKKSAERLEISRKKVELLDAKAKLAKLYEKFGKLNFIAIITTSHSLYYNMQNIAILFAIFNY